MSTPMACQDCTDVHGDTTELRELNADQLTSEYKGRLRDSYDPIFGFIARLVLPLVEAGMKRRKNGGVE